MNRDIHISKSQIRAALQHELDQRLGMKQARDQGFFPAEIEGLLDYNLDKDIAGLQKQIEDLDK